MALIIFSGILLEKWFEKEKAENNSYECLTQSNQGESEQSQ